MTVTDVINGFEGDENADIITTFMSFIPKELENDENVLHLLYIIINAIIDIRTSANNILEIGEKDYKINIWIEYFVKANIYWSGTVDAIPFTITDMRTLDQIQYDNMQMDIIIDNRIQTLDSLFNSIKLFAPLLTENGKLIIRNIPNYEWNSIVREQSKNIYNGLKFQYYNLSNIDDNNNIQSDSVLIVTRLQNFEIIKIDYSHSLTEKNGLLPGFFSNCTTKLENIMGLHKKNIDITDDLLKTMCILTKNYIPSDRSNEDLISYFFKKPDNSTISVVLPDNFSVEDISKDKDLVTHEEKDEMGKVIYRTYQIRLTRDTVLSQWTNYMTNNYEFINPFIEKYFTPADNIIELMNRQIDKYNINVLDTCALYYRGTDKIVETNTGDFEIFGNRIKEIQSNNSDIKIFLQTDSTGMLDYMKLNFPDVIYFTENITSYKNFGLHYELTPEQNFEQIQLLFASILMMAKCKFVVANSSNSSYWISLYRGNANDFYQWEGKFLCDVDDE
jgi:hypothetical protein